MDAEFLRRIALLDSFSAPFSTSKAGGDLSYYCVCYSLLTTLATGWLATRPFSVDVWKCNIAPGIFCCLPREFSLPIPAAPFSSSKALSNAGRTDTFAGKFPISVWSASKKNRTPAQAQTQRRFVRNLPLHLKLPSLRTLARSPAVRLWLPRLHLAAQRSPPSTTAQKPPEFPRSPPPASTKAKFGYNDLFFRGQWLRPETYRSRGGLT